jgi:hypothetical protein
MKGRVPFLLTAVLLVLFAAGHTYGFLAFKPTSSEGLAVLSGMRSVSFTFGHSTHTYWDFYLGFGLFVSIYLLLAAVVAWELPVVREASRACYVVLAGALSIAQLVTAAICARLFNGPPLLLSVLIVASLAWGMLASFGSERARVAAGGPTASRARDMR